MNERKLLEDQAAAVLDCRLAYLLHGRADDLEIRVTPWVDHGIRDEEGVPTAFETPTVYLGVASIFASTGTVYRSDNLPAAEFPALADGLRGPIDASIVAAIRSLKAEAARFAAIVDGHRAQISTLRALRPAP